MEDDPFTKVYKALWVLAERNETLTDLIKLNNRIKFDRRNAMKDDVSSADLPELSLFTDGGLWNFQSTSSHSAFNRVYSWMITTGDMSMPQYNRIPADDPKAAADLLIRTIALGLGDDIFDGIVALCGDQFFTSLTIHEDVKASYYNSISNQWLRAAQLGPEYGPYANGFEWGGILWMNYRGTIGDATFIPTAEAYVFPRGVNGMFQQICGPTDSMSAVNTRGQLLYASQYVLPHDVGVELKTTSDCLMLNTRPAAVVKVTGSNMPAVPTLS